MKTIRRPGPNGRVQYLWSSSDYPTLELRTLAAALELLGFESEMAKALRADIDLHELLGAQLAGTDLAVFKTWKKHADPALQAKYKAFRQMAKAGNFGLPGGLGATKLVAYARDSYGARLCLLSGRASECGVEKFHDKRSKVTVCSMCRNVAVELKKTWFAAWPEMLGYFELVKEWTATEVRETVDEDGFPEEMNVGAVTQLITERVRGGCTFTNGANTIFQGLAADIAKRALWLVTRECYTDRNSPLWSSRPVVFVHDEIITEHPIHKASAAARRVGTLMDKAFTDMCPTLPCRVEPALMARWYKEAEGVEVDGQLVPWAPKESAKAA